MGLVAGLTRFEAQGLGGLIVALVEEFFAGCMILGFALVEKIH